MSSNSFSKFKGVLLGLGCLALIPTLLQSCSNAKKVPYFINIADSTQKEYTLKEHNYVEPVIQVNDQLYVTVQTIDTKPGGEGTTTGSNVNDKNNTFIVDKNGMIEVPLVGRVNVLGQTSTEAKETIRNKATQYFVNPIVNVRFMNFYINILGDVARPGRYVVTDEKTSIIDALALAGDLNITGKRDNILLVREENGEKKFIRFDMNSTEIFKSPYYFLRSGDYIYVQQSKAKARSGTSDTSRDRYISITTSIVSLFAVLYTILGRNN